MLDQEQKSEAGALFREASECDPSDMVARNGLVRLLVHTSREGKAEDLRICCAGPSKIPRMIYRPLPPGPIPDRLGCPEAAAALAPTGHLPVSAR